jgi:peptide/nickel transport system permease protein
MDALTITASIFKQFWPVWIGLGLLFGIGLTLRQRLGLFGRLLESPVGVVGLVIVLFWLLTAFLAQFIVTTDPLQQVSGMKSALPGTVLPTGDGVFLLGGDKLGRDVFSRMVVGSRTVLAIAPAATFFAFVIAFMLGLPAGYFGGRFDSGLSFVANLILSFPVILLFYLLVTPEITATGIPTIAAAILFLFPIIFATTLIWSHFSGERWRLCLYLSAVFGLGGWAYAGLAFNRDPLGFFWMDPNLLNIFISVVFVNAPAIFRLVRGLTLDLQTRDYVAAARTRGESAWYIMLWEILPNARGPLIVDFCLRVGYTTILLGTLGFFGLGVSPESPDWGMTINEGRKLISIYPHPALPPAIALMSLVLGLNLLADGLREQSLKD